MGNNTTKLRVLDFVEGTSVDGPGLRTTIYFAGCQHHCPGCHNPQSWDMDGGREMTIDEITEVIEKNGFNVTFSGGDPLYQAEGVTELALRLRDLGYTLWCYTGFLWEEIKDQPRYRQLLECLDVLVDGPFIASLRDTELLFLGSSNQRLIRVKPSLDAGEPIQYCPDLKPF